MLSREMEIETCKFCNEGQIEIDEGCGIRVCTTCGRVEASFPNLVDRFDANVLQNPNLYDTIPLDECQFCESKKIHSLNLWGNSLGIPKNVLEEAKSIFVEIEMAHTPVTLPKDMLALFLIYVSGRKLHFPISLPQLAAAVGIRFCFFLKQLRFTKSLEFVDQKCLKALSGDISFRLGSTFLYRFHRILCQRDRRRLSLKSF